MTAPTSEVAFILSHEPKFARFPAFPAELERLRVEILAGRIECMAVKDAIQAVVVRDCSAEVHPDIIEFRARAVGIRAGLALWRMVRYGSVTLTPIQQEQDAALAFAEYSQRHRRRLFETS